MYAGWWCDLRMIGCRCSTTSLMVRCHCGVDVLLVDCEFDAVRLVYILYLFGDCRLRVRAVYVTVVTFFICMLLYWLLMYWKKIARGMIRTGGVWVYRRVLLLYATHPWF